MRLLPGVRLVDRPGALHFFDGRRVVSLRGDEIGRAAIRRALDLRVDRPAPSSGSQALDSDAERLITRFQIGAEAADTDTDIDGAVSARFASAAVGGQTNAQLAAQRLSEVEVHVWDSPDEGLGRAFAASGLTVHPLLGVERIGRLDPRRAIVAVVASDDQPIERLLTVNDACLSAGVSWLPVGGFDGAVVRVGPLMIPGQTACAHCLLRRLAANVAYSEIYEDIATAPSAPTAAVVRTWSYAMATLVALLWITTQDPDLPGRLFTLNPQELSTRSARVFRVPRCQVCAAPDFTPAPAPWSLGRDH